MHGVFLVQPPNKSWRKKPDSVELETSLDTPSLKPLELHGKKYDFKFYKNNIQIENKAFKDFQGHHGVEYAKPVSKNQARSSIAGWGGHNSNE